MGRLPSFGLSSAPKGNEKESLPALREEEKVLQSWFVGNEPDFGVLREDDGAALYEAILASGVYRPGEVEKNLIIEHRNDIQSYIRNVLVMRGVGNGEKERLLLEGYPRLSHLLIAGIEPNVEQAGLAERTFEEFAREQGAVLHRHPCFTTMHDAELRYETFGSATDRRTYTNFGFNVAMYPKAKLHEQHKRLLPSHRKGKDDTLIFSYHVAPQDDDDEGVIKIKKVYDNPESEAFVMRCIERQYAKLQHSGYVFDRAKWKYDVSYNRESKQIEIGAIPQEEVKVVLSNGTILRREPNQKVIVYISRRDKERDMEEFLRNDDLRIEEHRVQDYVGLVVASNQNKGSDTRALAYMSAALVLALACLLTLRFNRENYEKSQKLQFLKGYYAGKTRLTLRGDYEQEDLEGARLQEWRDNLTNQMEDIFVSIYRPGEGAASAMKHIISDWVRNNAGKDEYFVRMNGIDNFDLMYVLTQVIVPSNSELLTSLGVEIHPYFESYSFQNTMSFEETILFNTLFPDETVPTSANQIGDGATEIPMEQSSQKYFGLYHILPVPWGDNMISNDELYTDGYRLYAHRHPANYKTERGMITDRPEYEYSNRTREEGRNAATSIVFWRNLLVQEAFKRIVERRGYAKYSPEFQELAGLLVEYRVYNRIKGGLKDYNPTSPEDYQVWQLVDAFETNLEKQPLLKEKFSSVNAFMASYTLEGKATHSLQDGNELSLVKKPWDNLRIGPNLFAEYNLQEVGIYTTKYGSKYQTAIATIEGRGYIVAYSLDLPKADYNYGIYTFGDAQRVMDDYAPEGGWGW